MKNYVWYKIHEILCTNHSNVNMYWINKIYVEILLLHMKGMKNMDLDFLNKKKGQKDKDIL